MYIFPGKDVHAFRKTRTCFFKIHLRAVSRPCTPWPTPTGFL